MRTKSSIGRMVTLALAGTVLISACGQNPLQNPPIAASTPQPQVIVADADPQGTARDTDPAPPAESDIAPATSPPSQSDDLAADESGKVQSLSEREQKELLGKRLKGGMQRAFRQFANMFLVSSRIQLDVGIGLMTLSPEIAKTELMSPFPNFYRPTVREFLDAIALETFSDWKYDPTNRFIENDVPGTPPVKGLAIFEFTKKERQKPFTVTMADGWKTRDQGYWLMLIPREFPVGLDIYEMGTYSTEGANEGEFFTQVRDAVALEWAQRARESAKAEDMKPAKVGSYDALFYEALIPSQLGKDIRWRQWVFMVDDKCYFIVSTILPELDAKIFPNVERMLATFQAKKPE